MLLVCRKGMSIRFTASDSAMRPMGRSTSGVIGMHFRDDDHLLAARQRRRATSGYVFVVTEGGYAKRTAVDQYRVQSRGGLGIKVAKLNESGATSRAPSSSTRTTRCSWFLPAARWYALPCAEVPAKGRDTMGVVFARFADDDRIIAIAKNSERNLDDQELDARRRRRPLPDEEPGKDEWQMSSVAEKLQRKSQRPEPPSRFA